MCTPCHLSKTQEEDNLDSEARLAPGTLGVCVCRAPTHSPEAFEVKHSTVCSPTPTACTDSVSACVWMLKPYWVQTLAVLHSLTLDDQRMNYLSCVLLVSGHCDGRQVSVVERGTEVRG